MQETGSKLDFSGEVNIRNKKAAREYEFVETYVAGIELKGTEIKSIRLGKASLQEGYCLFRGNELFLKNATISKYEASSFYTHEPDRERKLLLNRRELDKIKKASNEKGFTIIPVRLFVNKKGLAKLEIAVARGKKLYDKRQSLKEKDLKREISRDKSRY